MASQEIRLDAYIDFQGVILKCVKVSKGCEDCFFKNNLCLINGLLCSRLDREDRQDVKFIKVGVR